MKNKHSYNNLKLARVMILFCVLLGTQKVEAQNISTDTLIQTMQNIYKNYDSIKYLSFDIRFNYSSDTLLGKYDNEQLDGTYTLAGKKTKYRLGNIDFMQNDSFFIAVYNDDKMILVDDPKIKNAGSQLPLRQMMDSLVQGYTSHYTITKSNVGPDTVVINFLRADSLARFDMFNMTYDNRNKMLYKVAYEFSELSAIDSTLSGVVIMPSMRKKRLTVQFSKYRFENFDEMVYRENNYIYFERGVCKPAAKYEGYKIYNSRPDRNIMLDYKH